MKSRFTICAFDKRTSNGFVYYVDAWTAGAAVQQLYDDAEANDRIRTDIVTVAVFNGHLIDSLGG